LLGSGKTKGMLNRLLSVFLESRCPFCDRPTAEYLCQYCSANLSTQQFASNDRLKLYRTRSTFAWGRYEGLLKRAIALMKYDCQPVIGEILGTFLGQAWCDSGLSKLHPHLAVVPIPMHLQKQKLRGFNQAEIIAHSFCQVTGYRLNKQTLIRTRATEAMFNLVSISARAKNLEGALQIGAKLPKRPVLLIDDIYTTGTTVDEAVKTLQLHKIKVIGVAVAAKAGR